MEEKADEAMKKDPTVTPEIAKAAAAISDRIERGLKAVETLRRIELPKHMTDNGDFVQLLQAVRTLGEVTTSALGDAFEALREACILWYKSAVQDTALAGLGLPAIPARVETLESKIHGWGPQRCAEVERSLIKVVENRVDRAETKILQLGNSLKIQNLATKKIKNSKKEAHPGKKGSKKRRPKKPIPPWIKELPSEVAILGSDGKLVVRQFGMLKRFPSGEILFRAAQDKKWWIYNPTTKMARISETTPKGVKLDTFVRLPEPKVREPATLLNRRKRSDKKAGPKSSIAGRNVSSGGTMRPDIPPFSAPTGPSGSSPPIGGVIQSSNLLAVSNVYNTTGQTDAPNPTNTKMQEEKPLKGGEARAGSSQGKNG